MEQVIGLSYHRSGVDSISQRSLVNTAQGLYAALCYEMARARRRIAELEQQMPETADQGSS